VQAYAFLQERSDPELLRRFERPSLSLAAARLYGAALTRVQVAEGTASAHAGGLEEDSAHLLAELADFLLTLDGARLAVATGYVKDDLVLTFRSVGGEGVDAGELARKLVAEGGSGGGHPTMARAVLPRAIADARVGSGDAERMSIAVLDYVARLVGGELTRRS
jgi:nanoRNase/pAp phosphatase (c-di-AMP/oligoRNAs hydrolase)